MTTSRTLNSLLMTAAVVALGTGLATSTRAATKTKYEAGFNRVVKLQYVAVTNGLTPPLTYAWSQTAGKTVAIANPSALTTTFVSDPVTEFVAIDDDRVGLVGIDTHQIEEATYKFRLIVTDANSNTATGDLVVVPGSVSPAQPNVPLGVFTYFTTTKDAPAYSWTLVAKPGTSTASLVNPTTRNPSLRPDVDGDYVVHDSVSDTNLTVSGSTWVGVQTCALCHGEDSYLPEVGLADMVTPWSKTGHATMAQRGIDGELSPYYNESCLACHTVGYNKAPKAVNDGFDDIAKIVGWAFPAVKTNGNYANLPAVLKNVSNIQCESCHGPGSNHPGSKSASLDTAVCATCHQDGHYHVRVEQWERSPHAEPYKELSFEEGTSLTCARCHAPTGFLDIAKGKAPTTIRTGTGALSCQTCHNPHDSYDNPDRHQLRIHDTVTLGDTNLVGTTTLTDLGNAATCVYCHNARRHPNQVQVSGSNAGKKYYQTGVPHESPVAEVLNGLGAVDYGLIMGNSFHTYYAQCTTCHMHENPPASSPDHNKLGDHTFSMSYVNGKGEKVENLAACNQCHDDFEPVDSFDFISVIAGDYDGNGETAGVQTETQGLLDLVLAKITETGVRVATNSAGEFTFPFFSNYVGTNNVALNDAQRKATWNWWLIHREGSRGVHNTQFTVRLLQTIYTDLNTNWTGNITATFHNNFPNAYLR